MKKMIPTRVQEAVDQYVEIYQVWKQLEVRMKSLRDVILPFMKEHEIQEIPDKLNMRKVQLFITQRAAMTSRYTTYDFAELAALMNPALLEKCVVSVVDKEKVMALSSLGEIDESILTHKSTQSSYSLQVRNAK